MVKYFFCIFFPLSLTIQGFAQQKLIEGTIVDSGAVLYLKPDFDSKQLNKIRPQVKVKMSPKLYKGSFGNFYRVVLNNGRVGFISDAEVYPEENRSIQEIDLVKGQKSSSGTKKKSLEKKAKTFKLQRDMLDVSWMGLTLSSMKYNEDAMEQNRSAQINLLGLKFVGKNLLIEGVLMDLTTQLFWQAPPYYEEVTGNKASGFMLLHESFLVFPIESTRTRMFYLGMGPAIHFSKFEITAGKTPLSLTQLRIGLGGSVGLVLRLNEWAFRTEIRLTKETYTYHSYLISFERSY